MRIRTAHTDARSERPSWPELARPFGGTGGALAVFALGYALLVWLGYFFKEDEDALTIIWPASGLLIFALWFAPARLWPALVAAQIAIELLIGAVMPGQPPATWAILIALSNSVDGMVGGGIARALFRRPARVHLQRLLQFVLATFVGALSGALFGAIAAQALMPEIPYLHRFQIWWAGNWLGALTLVPLSYSWALPLRRIYQQLQLVSRSELVLLALLLLAETTWIFYKPQGDASSVLQLPVILAAILAATAFRMPPRWAMLLAAATVLTSATLAARGTDPYPFAAGSNFIRLAQLQMFLAALMLLTALLSTAFADLRIALHQLGESEARYRAFVENSNEAVWRVELAHPMPLSLPLESQLEWLRRHAWVAECNLAYGKLEGAESQPPLPWRREVPWNAILESHLEAAARRGYSMDGLRFNANIDGRQHSFLTSFNGIVQNGQLLRLWGVARDVTELVELNTRLQREQERLKVYARQLVNAEEKARRAAAVDLHDGIGQSLVTMSMTLDAARAQSQPPVRSLIENLRAMLREVQERTRGMIADLSPPGLYDLGLEPALQWLSIYVRTHDRLQVNLACNLREEAIHVETRVLIFKLVRELLRNVAKHAGVSQASVQVRGDLEWLRVEVRDEGAGFEWRPDFFEARARGFGLWSIADRVREAGGDFEVDSSPGRGACIRFSVPLRRSVEEGTATMRRPAGGAM